MMLKICLCSLLTAALSLKMSGEMPCDRVGLMAARMLSLQRPKKELGTVYDMMDSFAEGQQFYNTFLAGDTICIDNWGYGDASGMESSLPEVRTSAKYHPCVFPSLDKFGQRLYHHVVTQGLAAGAMKGTSVLEVGCGRGKGSAYVAQNFGPLQYTGLDLSADRVQLARRVWGETQNLQFIQGSAMELPFPDNHHDIVINVESSFHYPDFPKFLREVYRVLKPTGTFLWVAPLLNRGDSVERKKAAFKATGFSISKLEDITPNVVWARRAHLQNASPSEFESICALLQRNASYIYEFWALPGSINEQFLASGDIPYIFIVAKKD